MINKSITNVVLKAAGEVSKIEVIKELLNHISLNYDYNDNKAGHILEMLVDPSAIVKIEDINLNYINEHLNLLLYKHNEYNIRNIKVESIDNIDCTVKVSYEYLEKINEDRDDVSYTNGYSSISFIDNSDILKK